MSATKDGARVVVIGGGIAGCSVAYHLAALGVRDVLLLERSMLSSGTTWHSTGNMETYRDDPLIFEMVRYAAELYPRLAAETDRDIGWRNVGRVMYTDREDRWTSFQMLPELGRTRGIEVELLDPESVGRRLPIIETEGLMGGVWIPSDARINATDAVLAFAAAAKARGVRIRTETAATAIESRDGRVLGVATPDGRIDCDTVVVASGLWSRDVLATCGFRAPLYTLEHQYLITKSQGIDSKLPLFLSYDDQLYGREEVGGLMVGSLDDRAIPLAASELPQNFSFALLNERWAQFEPYLATAMRRFPLLRTAEVKMLLNGPESFTPDGQMLLGQIPGISGVYACCGFNSNGIALSPAAGRFLSEWIVDGAPGADVTKLDVRRFSPAQSEERYLRARIPEIPGYHCRMHRADADYLTARDVLRSPLHDALVAEGARFGSINGWERATWIAACAADDDWLDVISAEVAAAEHAVLAIDRSADVKVSVEGDPCALAMLRKVPPKGGAGTWLQPLAGMYSQIEALVEVLPWTDGTVLIAAAPDLETRLLEWMRTIGVTLGLRCRDLTARFASLELIGPLATSLISRVTGPTAAAMASVPAVSSRVATVGGTPLHVQSSANGVRHRLTVPVEAAMGVWKSLQGSGREFGLRLGGHLAREAIRIRHGEPAFGREASPARLVEELGAYFAVPTGLVPAAVPPKTHRARRLVAFSTPLDTLGFGTGEVILEGGRTVGELTSRVRLPGWPATLALGLLNTNVPVSGVLVAVAAGRRWPLEPRITSWSEGQ